MQREVMRPAEVPRFHARSPVVAAGNVPVMIVWVKGPFGVGKSSTAGGLLTPSRGLPGPSGVAHWHDPDGRPSFPWQQTAYRSHEPAQPHLQRGDHQPLACTPMLGVVSTAAIGVVSPTRIMQVTSSDAFPARSRLRTVSLCSPIPGGTKVTVTGPPSVFGRAIPCLVTGGCKSVDRSG